MSDPVQAILEGSHQLDVAAAESLASADYQTLRAMVVGETESRNRSRAMAALAASGAPEAVAALGEVLANDQEPDSIRAGAAGHLGWVADPQAQAVLLENLPTATDFVVRLEVLSSLGKIGTPEALSQLEELAADPDPNVSRAARFNASVIAYRSGLTGYEQPVPPATALLEPDPQRSSPFYVDPASPFEARAIVQSLQRQTYGLRLASNMGYHIDCGRDRMFLAFAQTPEGRSITAMASERPTLPAIVADRAPSDGSYSVRWLVFVWPAEGDRFYIALHRSNGDQVMFGSGLGRQDEGEFELRSVVGRGNTPIAVRGHLSGRSIVLAEARSSPNVSMQIQPKLIAEGDETY